MLQVSLLVSLLCSSKNNVTLKITVDFIIDQMMILKVALFFSSTSFSSCITFVFFQK
jgi:hypothetical protein